MHVIPVGRDVGLRFSLETGELLGDRPRGVKSKQVKNMTRALLENHNQLGPWWEKAYGVPVVRVEG